MFFEENFLFLFSEKSFNVTKTTTPRFGDPFLTFSGHMPDYNWLELVELCQNQPLPPPQSPV